MKTTKVVEVKAWLVVVAVLAWISCANGQYEPDFLQPIDPEPGGVVVFPANHTIRMDEENDQSNLHVAKIEYTGTPAPRVTLIGGGPSGQPPPDIVITEEGGIYFVEVRTKFDYEVLAAAPTYAVSLTPPLPTPGVFYIQVVDINDNVPRINCEGGLEFSIPENTEATSIHTFTATDEDAIDAGQLKFGLEDLDLPSQEQTLFRIDQATGVLSLKPGETLDYEVRTSHRLVMSVVDSNPDHKAVCPVTLVNVEDQPDEIPRWLKFVSSISVEENKTIGEYPTFQYEAVDQDRGVNSPIEYSVRGMPTNSEGQPYFTIDSNTGLLSAANIIDADVMDETLLQFDAIATEVLEPYAVVEGSVFLTIVDVNDNPPRFADGSGERTFTVRIPEGYSETQELPLDGMEYSFIISDNDINPANNQYDAGFDEGTAGFISDALRVSPIRGSGKNSAFSVLITNRTKLDYEDPLWREENIRIVVKIEEPSKPEYYAVANIILDVENINDNEPRFPVGEVPDGVLLVNVPEDVKQDFVVVEKLNAVDDDWDDEKNYGTQSLRYKWYNRQPAHLTLDEVTGKITVNRDKAFDFERIEEELHIVKVCDMMCEDTSTEQRTITFTLHLVITDVNDEAPTIYIPPIDPIFENLTEEADIFSGRLVTVSDVDTNPDLEIALEILTHTDEADLTTWFRIEFVDNRTEGPGHSYDLTIYAQPNMVDREIIDRIEFRLTATDLNTADEFLEDKQAYSVEFSLTIRDVNDNPPVFEEVNGTTLELAYRESDFDDPVNDTSNREIYVFRASDPDSITEPLIYEITPHHAPMIDLVELVPISGSGNRARLSRKQGVPIDREATDIIPGGGDTDWLGYTISISDGTYTTELYVRITVEDINDNEPAFKEPVDYFEINEDANFDEPGHIVGTFLAEDRDIGDFGTVKYLVDLSYNGGNGTDKFAIDLESGRLFVTGQLDRETQERYNLQIRAIDYYRPATTVGSLWKDLQITIQLMDVNDNPPRFDPNARLQDISEVEAVAGRDLGVINVDDDDIGENGQLTFNIVEVTCSNPNVTNPEEMFTIESVPDGDNPTGVRVRAAVDFIYQWGIYTLKLSARDHGSPSLTTEETFDLNIIDVNLNSPIFVFPLESEPTVYITRGLAVGTSLEHYTSVGLPEKVPPCHATDDDDPQTGNGLVGYSLIRQNPDDDSVEYFSINNRAGVITVAQSLEDRPSTEFTITIQASDEGTPPKTTTAILRIRLVPIDNTPPVFSSSAAPPIEHPENNGTMLEVLLEATDEDIDDDLNVFNETICYYIGGGNEMNHFALVKEFNILTLQDGIPLDREAIDKYELQVCARNYRECPATASCAGLNSSSYLTVTIDVKDVNDESPVFETNENGIISGGIQVDAGIGSLNITVVALDRDLNDPVTYRISSQFQASHPSLPVTEPPFQLDRATGKLDNLFQPQLGMQGYYTFEITADDSNLPVPHSTPVDVKIYLITTEHGVQFRFNNRPEEFDPTDTRNQLASILSEIFEYQCNIERVSVRVDENGYPVQDPTGRTLVQTHFIKSQDSEPVISSVITSQRTNTEKMNLLYERLGERGFLLYSFGEDEDNSNPLSADKIAIYVLAAGLAVVFVCLAVLGVTCWFNNRSLSRRVRALTASTFGSQQSELNRAGVNDNKLPTTNQFAVQGSNPIWSSDANYPNFDQESVGSGGSVLIGAEDEEYFGRHNEAVNRNYASDGQSSDQVVDEDYSYMPQNPVSAKATDDMPNPLGAVSRRNPLLNLGDGDDTFM